MRKWRATVGLALVLGLAFVCGIMTACGDSKDGDKVAVTGIVLSEQSVIVEEGKTVTLTATIAPADATNKDVEWSVSEDSDGCITVNGGVVTGVEPGYGTVIATTKDGGKKAECDVTVIESRGEVVATKEFTENLTADKNKTTATFYQSSIEVNGYATSTLTGLEISTFISSFTVEDNEITFKTPTVKVSFSGIEMEFDMLTDISKLQNGNMFLRLKVNNGADWVIGEFEFTPAEAAKMGFDLDEMEAYIPVESVVFTETTKSVVSGTTVNLADLVTITPADASKKDVWTIFVKNAEGSDHVVSVTEATKTLTALKSGEADIQVTVDGKAATLKLTVTAAQKPADYTTHFEKTTLMNTDVLDFSALGVGLVSIGYVFKPDGTVEGYSSNNLIAVGYYTLTKDSADDTKYASIKMTIANGEAAAGTDLEITYDTDGTFYFICNTDHKVRNFGALEAQTVYGYSVTAPIASNKDITFKTDGTYTSAGKIAGTDVSDAGLYCYQTREGASYIIIYSTTTGDLNILTVAENSFVLDEQTYTKKAA